ncbi:MAG: hypothetical protein Q4C96_09345 [Planctomycetia bacterium]|nr:hypothetical protein [Planctomycetia bacterium]
MLKTLKKMKMFVILLLVCGASSGCMLTSMGPSLGILSFPIPVSPYFQNKQEEKAWEEGRYEETLILDPIPGGKPHVAEDAPSDDQVMRAFLKKHPVAGNYPGLFEVQHNDVRIIKEKVQDVVDEPRVHPLYGPVQVHHSHWMCKVYYTEIIRNGWPVPYSAKSEEKMDIIYIDLDHMHRVGNVVSGDYN